MDMEENSEQVDVDVFDLLPDAIVLEIFNRVEDARSLSACSILCKRFENLVTQTHNVSLKIIRRPDLSYHNFNKQKGGFLGRFVLNPVQALFHRLLSRKPKKTCSHCCEDDEEGDTVFRLPNDLLKNFKEIRSLSVKLPGHEGDISSEKWFWCGVEMEGGVWKRAPELRHFRCHRVSEITRPNSPKRR